MHNTEEEQADEEKARREGGEGEAEGAGEGEEKSRSIGTFRLRHPFFLRQRLLLLLAALTNCRILLAGFASLAINATTDANADVIQKLAKVRPMADRQTNRHKARQTETH